MKKYFKAFAVRGWINLQGFIETLKDYADEHCSHCADGGTDHVFSREIIRDVRCFGKPDFYIIAFFDESIEKEFRERIVIQIRKNYYEKLFSDRIQG